MTRAIGRFSTTPSTVDGRGNRRSAARWQTVPVDSPWTTIGGRPAAATCAADTGA
ncbi:hypothetical protein [Lentzea sp. NPDC055074]